MDAVVQYAEIRRLVEIMVQHGLLQFALDKLKALLNKPEQADDDTESDADTATYLKRDLPQQKRLF